MQKYIFPYEMGYKEGCTDGTEKGKAEATGQILLRGAELGLHMELLAAMADCSPFEACSIIADEITRSRPNSLEAILLDYDVAREDVYRHGERIARLTTTLCLITKNFRRIPADTIANALNCSIELVRSVINDNKHHALNRVILYNRTSKKLSTASFAKGVNHGIQKTVKEFIVGLAKQGISCGVIAAATGKKRAFVKRTIWKALTQSDDES